MRCQDIDLAGILQRVCEPYHNRPAFTPRPPESAEGQKLRFDPLRSLPVYPDQRTFSKFVGGMSRKCHFRTKRLAAKRGLFDQLIRDAKQIR